MTHWSEKPSQNSGPVSSTAVVSLSDLVLKGNWFIKSSNKGIIESVSSTLLRKNYLGEYYEILQWKICLGR